MGGRGEGPGGGCWGRGPAHWRRAASPRRAARALSSPGAATSTSALPPSPSQDGDTALDLAKKEKHTEVVKLLENFAAQVGRAAPHPATPSHRPCAVCDRAWSRIPGCSLTQHPRALSPDHSSPSTPYLKMGTQCICTHIYRRRRVARGAVVLLCC